MRYRILGLDPGVTNHAWAILEYDLQPFRYKILAHGMVINTIKDLKGSEYDKGCAAYRRELRKVMKNFGADHSIAERFQSRGLKGTTVECVSIMLGVLSSVSKENLLITASQWKNELNKITSLDLLYEEACCVPHQLDASLIALYGACKMNELKPFIKFNKNSWLRNLVKTNQGKDLKKEKKKKNTKR